MTGRFWTKTVIPPNIRKMNIFQYKNIQQGNTKNDWKEFGNIYWYRENTVWSSLRRSWPPENQRTGQLPSLKEVWVKVIAYADDMAITIRESFPVHSGIGRVKRAWGTTPKQETQQAYCRTHIIRSIIISFIDRAKYQTCRSDSSLKVTFFSVQTNVFYPNESFWNTIYKGT